jgi:hypothetical protein
MGVPDEVGWRSVGKVGEEDAAKALWYSFYEPVLSTLYRDEVILMFRSESGELVLPTKANADELPRRRDRLIGKDFRFTVPTLPKGAKYI